jgi:septal ring factor EnvC (AmiA/AmiB activator)
MRVALCLGVAAVHAASVNPIEKVLELLGGMRSKIIAQGEEEQKSYEEFSHWCRQTAKGLQREVADSQEEKSQLEATIQKAKANINSLTEQIGELAAGQQSADKELTEATQVRAKEAADYSKVAAELSTSIDELSMAITELERMMAATSASLVQTPSIVKLVSGLKSIVGATIVDANDRAKLDAFLQSGTDAMQAPEAAAYSEHSGGIDEVLQNLLSKAEAQKADADKAEMQAKHDFMGLKASLQASIETQADEQEKAKKELASNEQTLAGATADLSEAVKELNEDTQSLNDAHDECEERAHDWDVSMQSRAHEIGALDTAVKVLQEKTGGAQKQAYSFLLQLQVSSKSDQISDVVQELMKLGKAMQDRHIALLAMRVRSAASGTADPFAKVKGLIEDMIADLEKQAAEEASAKAFCDSETSKSKAKKDEHESTISTLSSKIDFANSRIAKLKEQIATLTEELRDIANEQSEATAIRQTEKETFKTAEADYQGGLEGVQMALKVLRDYYGQSFAQVDQPATPSHSKGDASSIIGMLEVAESDFGKLLAEARDVEESSAGEYEQSSEDNKIATQTKKQDVEYKNKEILELQHALSEHGNDREGEQEELDSVLEYLSKLNDQCVAKPEPYEERKRRREQEIEGLKNALDILEGQAIGFLSVARKTTRA